jgi:hypothetical protein
MVLIIQEGLLALIGSRFALSEDSRSGIACCEEGLFVAGVALLEKALERNAGWLPRPVSDLNREIAQQYGLPFDLSAKLDSLRAIARALDVGDLIYARLLTLHLRIPDPPEDKSNVDELVVLARRFRANGLLKVAWDPTKHPRWPAGSPGSVGGEFAPAGTSGDPETDEQTSQTTTAQITIPAPWALPDLTPFPSEIVPAPLAPNFDPRHSLESYPDRPECVEEWAYAISYCQKLIGRGLLGTDGYRGSGKNFQQCVLGLVSESCGGNSVS